ncbi:MotA/TolQ/ExbB proton channel family protein [Elizabethkingia anophelis]|jgi:biopolymer transport protein ExbB|uniref:Biopolymer transport protein ExbB n=3 Tax=Elizabethkingia TaxID=308865 RepID=A0AAQ1PIY3_ELIMR|nr:MULTISPECIES: MotA/TolQ/ExbB proton channel family protein [Elizabethkingia]MDR2227980.1 MotA/TolQ/ExbB proton channel family protein [Flavobacteriaceae bacterium]AIL43877.1 MotA/TolQ/ExbB proton channel family protein [Elizabethkingia anophelis NUHP1]AKH96399.1 biopolymer transporter ExbB [Elizabethkingia anophelis FMS-007]AQX08936.1 biopolymer transporter ExbB [Elizabethkingia ursingii]ATL44608.1 MotA/TolQ/ExbB proton channel family protein [Elizabethkingia miricola]
MAFLEISTILQAQTQVAATTQEFSFWKIMFHGNIFANVVMITVLLLGIFSFYLFLERFFFIKRMSSNTDPNLMRNIEDFLKDGKVDAAIDYCSRQDSPEARILEKGLSRIGRPVSDIVNAMEGQGQAEVANMEMNLNLLAAVPSIAPMLGLLGTVIGMILAFFNLSNSTGSFSPKTLSEGIYTALGQTATGLAVAIPANFFYNLLLTKIDKFILKIQNLSAEFLDIINKPL